MHLLPWQRAHSKGLEALGKNPKWPYHSATPALDPDQKSTMVGRRFELPKNGHTIPEHPSSTEERPRPPSSQMVGSPFHLAQKWPYHPSILVTLNRGIWGPGPQISRMVGRRFDLAEKWPYHPRILVAPTGRGSRALSHGSHGW